MAHFYGEIQGNRGEATRMGTKDSGFRGHIRGWHVGGSINCYYNESKDRDEVSIYATKGSNGYGSEHLADVIELDSGSKIIVNHKLPKLLHACDYVQMKEDISALIFDYEPDDNSDLIEQSRPHEEDCNAIAELIMTKLGFELYDPEPKE
jgi:hypothetical protein